MSDDLSTLREMYEDAKTKVEASPDYRRMLALRAAIAKMEAPVPTIGAASPPLGKPTIEGLAAAFVRRAGEPKPIREVFDYIHGVRKFPFPKKARVNVVSALSKGKALRSVTWNGEAAWWLAGEPLPKDNSASATK